MSQNPFRIICHYFPRVLRILRFALQVRALAPTPRPRSLCNHFISYHKKEQNAYKTIPNVPFQFYCKCKILFLLHQHKIWKFFGETIFEEIFNASLWSSQGRFFCTNNSHNFLLIRPQLCDYQQLFTWLY